MSDRELLEAAAKAAGIDAEWHNDDDADFDAAHEGLFLKGARGPTNSKYWNPLTDDGDALRLAVALRLGLEWWKSGVSAESPQHGSSGIQAFDGDPYAATRRAIVRAAAAMANDQT